MKHFFSSVLLIVILLGHSVAEEVYTLDFKESNHLKVLFDAGLHPRHVKNLDRIKCSTQEATLEFLLPQSEAFEFTAQRTSFSVLENDEIFGLTCTGYIDKIDKTLEVAKRICQAINMPVEGLDSFVEELKRKPVIESGNYWSKRIRRDDFRVHLVFKPVIGLDQESPETDYRKISGASINLSIGWTKYPSAMKRSRSKPIEPPPGYEHLSMDPLPYESSSNKKSTKLAEETKTEPELKVAKQEQPTVSGVKEAEEDDNMLGLWIGLALVLIAGCGGAFYWLTTNKQQAA